MCWFPYRPSPFHWAITTNPVRVPGSLRKTGQSPPWGSALEEAESKYLCEG